MKIQNTIFETGSLLRFTQCNLLPIIMSFQIRNFLKKFKDVEDSYFEEKRKLIDKYKPAPDKKNPEFIKRLNVLLNIETEIAGEKLKIDINKLPDSLLSPLDIMNLEGIFEFSENSEKPKSKKRKVR